MPEIAPDASVSPKAIVYASLTATATALAGGTLITLGDQTAPYGATMFIGDGSRSGASVLVRLPVWTVQRKSLASPRFSIGCLIAAVPVVCVALGSCFALICYVEGEDFVQRFDCGAGREILITAARSWEVSQPVYYVVTIDGKTEVPATYLTNSPGGDATVMNFQMHLTPDGQVVGIIDPSNPQTYLVIHDFRDGASWPRGEMDKRFRGSGTNTFDDLSLLLPGVNNVQ